MPRVAKYRDLKLKKNPKKGVCVMIENGKACNRPVHCRGLCSKHHTYMLRHKRLEEFGNDHIFDYFKDKKYTVIETPEDVCQIAVDGEPCGRPVHGRKLCAKHWLHFERHGVLEKFGSKSRKDARTLTVKKKIVKGVCRIIENGKGCKRDAVCRGMCAKHYLYTMRKGLHKKLGAKKR